MTQAAPDSASAAASVLSGPAQPASAGISAAVAGGAGVAVRSAAAWHRDLVALLVEGISKGEFRPVDAERFATRTRALLDGFGSQLVVGLPGTQREEVRGHIREFLDESLSARES
nr:TetR family transcriptional regulator C-terminal domain-containing protein [Streptomyces lydicus]